MQIDVFSLVSRDCASGEGLRVGGGDCAIPPVRKSAYGWGTRHAVKASFGYRGSAGFASGFDEAVAALPLELEAGPDGVDFGAGHGGVGVLDEVGGFEAG
jgi:hypothetical protein